MSKVSGSRRRESAGKAFGRGSQRGTRERSRLSAAAVAARPAAERVKPRAFLIPRFDDICSRRAKSPRWEEARAAGARAHEEPGARSRPFGRAERRCAGRRRSRVSGSDVGRAASRWPSQVPSERERREERRGRADWSCSSAAEERHGTRPLAVTVTEGGGSPSRRKMTWLFPTSFSLSDDRARPKVTAHEFSRRARSAAPGASTPSPSAGECEGSPLALPKIRPRPEGAEKKLPSGFA